VVICLEQGADLHMAQLMPLPLTLSCFSKVQIGFTFLVLAHLGSPGKRAVKRVCVCVCVCVCVLKPSFNDSVNLLHMLTFGIRPPHAALLCAVQQSINISCRPGHSSEPCSCGPCCDRRTPDSSVNYMLAVASRPYARSTMRYMTSVSFQQLRTLSTINSRHFTFNTTRGWSSCTPTATYSARTVV